MYNKCKKNPQFIVSIQFIALKKGMFRKKHSLFSKYHERPFNIIKLYIPVFPASLLSLFDSHGDFDLLLHLLYQQIKFEG